MKIERFLRRRYISWCSLGACLVVLAIPVPVHAQQEPAQDSTSATSASSDPAAKQAEAAAALKNTQWALELSLLGGETSAPKTNDVLRFMDGKVAAESFMKEGFP